VEGINQCILRQYRPAHDLVSQSIDLIAERHKRNSSQIAKPLLSAVRLADASLINDILRRHELVPMARLFKSAAGMGLTSSRCARLGQAHTGYLQKRRYTNDSNAERTAITLKNPMM
jgi:hypothetical protein